MRGLAMTRIEVFVDAAFAFAVTMLVISFDSIPTSFPELIAAIKSIPAFIVSVIQLVWIWNTHNKWSRRYGLETTSTVVLSTALLIVVLVYVYPVRILAQGMFAWFTSGYLIQEFQLKTYQELAGLIIFLSVGFIALCIVFALMYRHAASLANGLMLDEFELHETRMLAKTWLGAACIGLSCIILNLIVPDSWVPFTGFSYVLLAVWFPFMRSKHLSLAQERET